MKPVDKTSEDLFQKLRSRFSPVSMGDENADETATPNEARIFNFMYKENGEEIGYISISIIDNRSFKVYYGTDLVDRIQNKTGWYNFLKELRMFAKRNLMSFDARDLAKNQLEPRDFKFISSQDKTYKEHEVEVSESVMFGSRRKSYQTMENVKMIVNHRKSIDETIPGARSRYIESIYLERADGERYKFPYNYLTGARAMARHVNEGGNPYDDMGKHIVSMIKEMRDLSKFARRTKKHAMEDENAGSIRNSVVERFHNMKKQLGAMSVKEGYARFVENFSTEEALVEDEALQQVKEKFTQQVFDTQLEDTLPAVMKAIKEAQMKQVAEANTTIPSLIKNSPLILRKDDAADEMFRTTKFTDGAGLLGFILSDIASRIIGDNADQIANFASDAAERVQDKDYDQNDKQAAMMLAKKYMDDFKRILSDPAFKDNVRMDPKNVYGKMKKREGGFHESEQYEAWANELVPEEQVGEGAKEKIKGIIRREKAKDMPIIQSRGDYAAGKAADSFAKGDSKNGERYLKWRKKSQTKAGVGEDYDPNARDWSKKYADNEKHARNQAKSTVPLVARISPEWKKEHTKDADRQKALSKKYGNQAVTGMEESADQDSDQVAELILSYIEHKRPNLIKKYGEEQILNFARETAEMYAPISNISMDDLGFWAMEVSNNLNVNGSADRLPEDQVNELSPKLAKRASSDAKIKGYDYQHKAQRIDDKADTSYDGAAAIGYAKKANDYDSLSKKKFDQAKKFSSYARKKSPPGGPSSKKKVGEADDAWHLDRDDNITSISNKTADRRLKGPKTKQEKKDALASYMKHRKADDEAHGWTKTTEASNPELKQLIQSYASDIDQSQEYVWYGDDTMSDDYQTKAEKTLALIKSKFGEKAAEHAVRAANPNYSDFQKGDSLKGGLGKFLDKTPTKSGKLNKNTQKAMRNPNNNYYRKVGGPQGKLPEATTQGTVGTQGTTNPGQMLRDPKLQQAAKNVSRVTQAAGIKAPPNQIAQGMAAQATGKKVPTQTMQTIGGLGNTVMQAAASDPKKAAALTAMMKKMVTAGKFDEAAARNFLEQGIAEAPASTVINDPKTRTSTAFKAPGTTPAQPQGMQQWLWGTGQKQTPSAPAAPSQVKPVTPTAQFNKTQSAMPDMDAMVGQEKAKVTPAAPMIGKDPAVVKALAAKGFDPSGKKITAIPNQTGVAKANIPVGSMPSAKMPSIPANTGAAKANIPVGSMPASTGYTVKAGDNLSKILAGKGMAATPANIAKIAKLSGIKDPNMIKPGQTIKFN